LLKAQNNKGRGYRAVLTSRLNFPGFVCGHCRADALEQIAQRETAPIRQEVAAGQGRGHFATTMQSVGMARRRSAGCERPWPRPACSSDNIRQIPDGTGRVLRERQRDQKHNSQRYSTARQRVCDGIRRLYTPPLDRDDDILLAVQHVRHRGASLRARA